MELARRLEVPTNRVTGILNGQRAILQSLYELRLAEQRVGKTIKALPRLGRRDGRAARAS